MENMIKDMERGLSGVQYRPDAPKGVNLCAYVRESARRRAGEPLHVPATHSRLVVPIPFPL